MKKYGICRCCLSKCSRLDLQKEYDVDGRREGFTDVFIECFNLFLASDTRLPTQICQICITKLRDAQQFRQLVLDSERQLLDALGNNATTEFVNVGLDPLHDDDDDDDEPRVDDVKTEIKSESFEDISEDAYDLNPADLVPGEKELLERFPLLTPLPTRESLADRCPVFYQHLELLKGKVIEGKTIQLKCEQMSTETASYRDTNKIDFLIKKPEHRKYRKRIKKSNVIVSEKMAQALNATTILENCNAAVFKSKMRSGFPCFYCRKIFSNIKIMRQHQTKHPKNTLFKLLTKYTADALIVYADISNLRCTICEKEIPSFKDLKTHLTLDHNKRIYEDFSERVIPFKLEDKESNFDCHLCGANYVTFGALDRHMNVHHNNFVCDECGAGFITKHRLKVHAYLLHKSSERITCEPCKKIFPTRHKFKIHNENVHKKLKKVRCSICLEKFIDYFTRQRHMEEKHGTEPILYKCTECDRSFNRKYTLTCHFKRRHLENRDVQCELCPFMCYSKSELRDHMYKHGSDKSFECSVCKKCFMRKKTLTVHMRVHSNDLRYNCHLCGETFVQNWSLKSHLKTHSVE